MILVSARRNHFTATDVHLGNHGLCNLLSVLLGVVRVVVEDMNELLPSEAGVLMLGHVCVGTIGVASWRNKIALHALLDGPMLEHLFLNWRDIGSSIHPRHHNIDNNSPWVGTSTEDTVGTEGDIAVNVGTSLGSVGAVALTVVGVWT